MGGSDEEKEDHPTQKPIELMRRPILNHLTRDELVYDPFLGSGTTLAAAEITERVCFGMELDPNCVDVIVERWQKLSGKLATLEGDGRTFDQIKVARDSNEALHRENGNRMHSLGHPDSGWPASDGRRWDPRTKNAPGNPAA